MKATEKSKKELEKMNIDSLQTLYHICKAMIIIEEINKREIEKEDKK